MENPKAESVGPGFDAVPDAEPFGIPGEREFRRRDGHSGAEVETKRPTMNHSRELHRLARLQGILPSYYDVEHTLRVASDDSLLTLLQGFGVCLKNPEEAADALRKRRQDLWRTILDPVVVAWDGQAGIRLRLPADLASGGTFHGRIHFDGGEPDVRSTNGEPDYEWTGNFRDLPSVRQGANEGVDYVVQRLAVPQSLPLGYHRLTLEIPGQVLECLIISAPYMTFRPEKSEQCLRWGVFLPLYALHSESSWGGGDFSDFGALMEWVAAEGGRLVATLPLLASQWDLTDDPSPYSPSSRLFWNDFYVDVRNAPELEHCPAAQELLGAPALQAEIEELRRHGWADYRRQSVLKRRILEELSRSFFGREGDHRAAFDEFRRERPDVESYARFRAVCERLGRVWTEWPEPLRSGAIEPHDYDEEVYHYHLYAQWLASDQLSHLAHRAEALDLLWYLDFPLGVSRTGYDVWRERHLFALDFSGGAPPDPFFTKGQGWGFPPLRPDRLREQGYRYLIATIRHHLNLARVLRFDHVMSMYRLFWVPNGMEPKAGAYVRYYADEFFAILTLESYRYQARIIGENLGTVPDAVNASMIRHGVDEMYVVQYETRPDPRQPLRRIPQTSVASLNTHDMPPFTAFWTALDADDRLDLGLLDEERARHERELRADLRKILVAYLRQEGLLDEETFDPHRVTKAFLEWLAGSQSAFVLVNLEDLWGTTEPQNTPGTFKERPNWVRKTRFTLEEFTALPSAVDLLRAVHQRRCDAASEFNRPQQSAAGSRHAVPQELPPFDQT